MIVPQHINGGDWQELITQQPFIRYDRASFGGRQVDRFLRDNHCNISEVCEVDELEAIVKLVAKGVGVALVPQAMAQQSWPAGVRVIDLGERTFHRDIGLIHPTSGHLSEPARALAQLISQIAL